MVKLIVDLCSNINLHDVSLCTSSYPFVAGSAAQQMQRWAECLKVNGTYLEFTDFFLVCATHGLGLKLVSFAEGLLGCRVSQKDFFGRRTFLLGVAER